MKKNAKAKKIEEFADSLLSTCPEDMSCEKHENHVVDCVDCMFLCDKVKKYHTHNHSFTCAKNENA